MRPALGALALASLGSLGSGAGCGGGDAIGGKRDGGTDGPCVPLGSVAFRMEAPPVDGGYGYQLSLGDPGDGVWWYSVERPDGAALTIFLPPGAQTACGVCQPRPEPIGQGCAFVPDGGVSGGWGGITYTGTSTCQPAPATGYSSPVGCATTQCLPPGRYVVKMCGSKGGVFCSSPDCVEVPFDFPTDAAVVGHLPP
jgi:hypothetical protein